MTHGSIDTRGPSIFHPFFSPPSASFIPCFFFSTTVRLPVVIGGANCNSGHHKTTRKRSAGSNVEFICMKSSRRSSLATCPRPRPLSARGSHVTTLLFCALRFGVLLSSNRSTFSGVNEGAYLEKYEFTSDPRLCAPSSK